jgi:hypothetical protein
MTLISSDLARISASVPHRFGLTTTLILAASALLGACSDATPKAEAATPPRPLALAGATPEHPVVLELYQSQGCSSCPPANANLNALADEPGLLALSFAVTYWDQLGWKDIYGQPAFTARQWDYANHSGRRQVFTPQIVINGDRAIVGSNRAQLDATLSNAGPARGGPSIGVHGVHVTLSALPTQTSSIVWLVRYDPKVHEVPIRAGENGGRTLPHRNIVRQLVSLGGWNGHEVDFELPAANVVGLSSAILVQRGKGGPIISARKL